MLFLSVWSLSNHFQTKVFPSIKSNKKIKIVSILTNKKNHNFKNKNSFTDKKKIITIPHGVSKIFKFKNRKINKKKI